MNIIEDIAAFSKEEIKPIAGKIDQKQLFPRELVKKIAEHKYFSVIF